MTQAPTAPPTYTHQQKMATLVGVLLALFLAALDQTVVSTATPEIIKELQFKTSWITWLTTAYLVTSTATLPIWGKLSDLYGRRRIVMTGVVLFTLASMLCGLAQDPTQLVLYRALQGLGSAAIFSTAFAVVGDIFTPQERPKYQGFFGAVFGLSSVVGPYAGGLLTDFISWRWVFYINVPIAIVALWFMITKMPPLKTSRGGKIDYVGGVLLITAVVPLLLALTLAPDTYAWGSPQIIGMFALALVSLILFIMQERRTAEPIVDLGLFKDRTYSITAVAAFLLGAAFLGTIVFLPLFMVNVLGVSATSAGAALTPLTLGVVAGNILSGQLVARIGKYKPVLLGSLVLLLVGYLILVFTLHPDETQFSIISKLVLLGIGLGPSIPLYTQLMINTAPRNKIGMASSSATFLRQMGSTIGVAILGTVFASSLTHQFESKVVPLVPKEMQSQFVGQKGAPREGSSEAAGFDEKKLIQDAHRKFEDQRTLAKAALIDNKPEAMKAFARNPQIPAQFKETLASGRVAPEARPFLKAAYDDTLRSLDAVEKDTTASIHKVGVAYKTAWTDAIRGIFEVGLIVVILGMIVTALIPEVPFQKQQGPQAPPVMD
ncbi:MDR family MFS transporter [Deinococcus cellulosilyticus]|uniref:MFS transporter n=1 Tax=Deinococcus cellulosilyticus (strain DSM 18568 / NBRC 106333 / KACC 11606 / 5516J-15) TaxID=1223518 RepID=A0A511NA67_DEIC1|nr:MDR family MFS transporter [Deinococcus cellulosilyticus]GEM49426.1 MFS transporter [Deinococcus cellulosilyticus NBRC 106333 = KACC 11606]